MFSLMNNGSSNGSYTVRLDKEYSVYEFISTLLTDFKHNWGTVRIQQTNCSMFYFPKCDYKFGYISENTIPSDMIRRKIKSVKAEGSWPKMDYLITLKNG